ncbi:hypothetical protein EV182_005132, partial [Spiromyces aspiralis]
GISKSLSSYQSAVLDHTKALYKSAPPVIPAARGNVSVASPALSVATDDSATDTFNRYSVEKLVRKSVTTYRDLGDMRSSVDNLYRELHECQQLAIDKGIQLNAKATAARTGDVLVSEKDRRDAFVQALRLIAEKLGLVCYTDKSTGEGGVEVFSVTVCGDIIVLDVDIDSRTVVRKVKLTYATDTQHDEGTDRLFNHNVREMDFAALERNLGMLAKLDKLNSKYKPADFFHQSNAIIRTLDTVAKKEVDALHGQYSELIERGSGIPLPHYHRPAPQVLLYVRREVAAMMSNDGWRRLLESRGTDSEIQRSVLAKCGTWATLDWQPAVTADGGAGAWGFLPPSYDSFVVVDPTNFPNYSQLRLIDQPHPTIQELSIKYIDPRVATATSAGLGKDSGASLGILKSPITNGGVIGSPLSSAQQQHGSANMLAPYGLVLNLESQLY